MLRISDQLAETMVIHGRRDRTSALAHAVKLLGRMGLTTPERAVTGFPHQFSGGMRQRVMLAMGFSNEPSLLIADEPTSSSMSRSRRRSWICCASSMPISGLPLS